MKTNAQTTSFYDLCDGLARPGCAICRLKADSADRLLDGLLREGVTDPGRRGEIRQAQGFCHKHAWRLARPGASLGVAIVTRDVLQSVLETMKGATYQALPPLSIRRAYEALAPKQPAAATAGLVARLEPQTVCPACVWAERMEDIYLSTLVDNLLCEGGLLTMYEESDGLCLPHFRQALAKVRDERAFEALINTQRAIWERLLTHLSEFIRKSDYRFQEESWGEERDAWLRAIAALVGACPDPHKL